MAGEGACSWHMPESPSGLSALNNGLLLAAEVGAGASASHSRGVFVCLSRALPTYQALCGGGVGPSLFPAQLLPANQGRQNWGLDMA